VLQLPRFLLHEGFNTMPIAIQEDMLPGRTMLEKFEQARTLGIDGVEFWGASLEPKLDDIVMAREQTGVRVAAINHGRQHDFVDPNPDERELALAELRMSIMCAADLGAKGVIFVPHFGKPALPDLTPWMMANELQAELVFQHLRTMSDYADAMGVELYVESINRYETTFLNRLEQSSSITRRLNHPRVKIVADLFHMSLEEDSIEQAIHDNKDQIGHVHLADSNRRLPGQGLTDFAAAASALRAIGYGGWAAFECGDVGRNAHNAPRYLRELPASLDLLHSAGFA
jgi:sugar phosphate isomerase/epimerase